MDKIKEVLQAIIETDKTSYDYPAYHRSEKARIKHVYNPRGEMPPVGQRWMTPRELAEEALRSLEAN